MSTAPHSTASESTASESTEASGGPATGSGPDGGDPSGTGAYGTGPDGTPGAGAEAWFLTAEERGNPFTRLTYRRDGAAFSHGNATSALVHGVAYFRRLVEVVEGMRAGDLLLFTDWRGDGDELLTPEGPTVSALLVAAATRGVDVRGLFWRSHLDLLHYSERNNRDLADTVRRAGGEVVLDQRVPPMGCTTRSSSSPGIRAVPSATWPSSAARTCATRVATTPRTTAIRRRSRWARSGATLPPGTTS